ncbi:MAG: HigA family addiction module antitoxin [Prevotellaceae bacterium]|nr:HigA family addiction module antitoxin [Prevotellaceae bacterium]
MATRNDRLIPNRAVHPGEILREELRERGITQKDFASQIGMQATHLSEFIKGKRNLNEDLAMRLEASLGIPYKTWMGLHNTYVYDSKAIEDRREEDLSALKFEQACAANIDLQCLYKRLGIAKLPCQERVRKLKELFPSDMLPFDKLHPQVRGMYKHSEKVQINDKSMLTWIALNWLETSRSKVENDYVQGNALRAAQDIALMANHQEMDTTAVKRCLESYGIAYLEVPKIEKTPIDAYSTIAGGHPCITVTYRYNDVDKLAFDILHELCHIERHLSGEQRAFISIEGNEYSSDPHEREANAFARQMLIPEETWNHILNVGSKNLSPHRVVKAIASEAEKNGISPSIAVSRYKHDTHWYSTPLYKSPKIHFH